MPYNNNELAYKNNIRRATGSLSVIMPYNNNELAYKNNMLYPACLFF
jgi:hypothetical protein